jgi:hypothetical protein
VQLGEVWWSVAKCCSVVMVLVIKLSNIIWRHTDNRKLLLICIMLLSDSFIFFRLNFLSIYIVVFLFNTIIYIFLLLGLCILIVRLPWLRFFRAFSSVVRQMPAYNLPSRGTARTLPKFLCCSMYCSFCVLFVCKCVLYNCHRLATQMQLTNISYHIICVRVCCFYICFILEDDEDRSKHVGGMIECA